MQLLVSSAFTSRPAYTRMAKRRDSTAERVSELRSCAKEELDVMGSPSPAGRSHVSALFINEEQKRVGF